MNENDDTHVFWDRPLSGTLCLHTNSWSHRALCSSNRTWFISEQNGRISQSYSLLSWRLTNLAKTCTTPKGAQTVVSVFNKFHVALTVPSHHLSNLLSAISLSIKMRRETHFMKKHALRVERLTYGCFMIFLQVNFSKYFK